MHDNEENGRQVPLNHVRHVVQREILEAVGKIIESVRDAQHAAHHARMLVKAWEQMDSVGDGGIVVNMTSEHFLGIETATWDCMEQIMHVTRPDDEDDAELDKLRDVLPEGMVGHLKNLALEGMVTFADERAKALAD